jgi:glycosyltransferase involved in cell wall biosynthesis
MKILMILSNPFTVDPRVHSEAKALTDDGHKVTVLVWDRREEHRQEDVIDGIHIVNIRNTSFMKILRSDLLRNPFWWRAAYRKSLELYKNGFKFDVVHCHDLDTLNPGVRLKKKFGIKLIFDAHEIFGYMIEGQHPLASKIAFYLEKRLIKHVDHIITVDDPFKKYYENLAHKPITTVMNCKDLVFDRYESPKNKTFTLVYIGIMTRWRFFPEIIDIVSELKDVKLILAGKKEGIYHEMEEYAKKYKNIEFRGTIPTQDILKLTRDGDALFLIVDNTRKQAKIVVFNKQFEAMVCGRPIIITNGIYAAEMTEKLNCGLTVEYNKESVKEAIIKLRDNSDLCEKLGRNALNAAKKQYNWENEKKNLLKVYEEIK